MIEPLYRDDNLSLWDMGDAGQQRSDDQDVIYQAVNLTQDEGGEKTDLELEGRRRRVGGRARACSSRPRRAEEQAAIEAALAQPYHYDEWDYIIGMDRPAWCTLLEKAAPAGDPHAIDEVLRRNEETVNRLTSLIKAVQIQRPQRLRRQLEGDRLDIDASIAATVDLRSGRAPDPRVHQRLGRNSRDLAVLLLLDLSQSTNDWVPSAGTTVLNLAREATALVAHAMDQLGDDFAIHGFDSNGRHDVEYYRFKDFETPYGEEAKARLAGMRGQLSTRMGTALRHAGHFLRSRRVGAQADPAAHRRRAARHRRARQAVSGVRHQARGGGPAPPWHPDLLHDAWIAAPTSTSRASSAGATTWCWTSSSACPRSCRRCICGLLPDPVSRPALPGNLPRARAVRGSAGGAVYAVAANAPVPRRGS